jgi:hypothetical protein
VGKYNLNGYKLNGDTYKVDVGGIWKSGKIGEINGTK